MTIYLRCSDPQQTFSVMLPDESLSSWVSRHRHVISSVDDETIPTIDEDPNDDYQKDDDFGTLRIDLPCVPLSLIAQLQQAAIAPDPWLIKPDDRTLYCARCRLGDWASGIASYERRQWAVATRTCCAAHGELEDTLREHPELNLLEMLRRRPWHQQLVSVRSWGRGEGLLSFCTFDDQRAIHLEDALATDDPTSGWFPQGFDPTSLRLAYAQIIRSLLVQFRLHQDQPNVPFLTPAERALHEFARLPNYSRFALNVCAEAIIACWSRSPLPPSAPHFRTHLIVRMVGWDIEPAPRTRSDQVLMRISTYFQPKMDQLERCARLFPPEVSRDQQVHALRQKKEGRNTDCVRLTKRQAEAIGRDTRGFDCLKDITSRGRLGLFDQRRGTLRPLPGAGTLSRLERDRIRETELGMPAWVEQSVVNTIRRAVPSLSFRLFDPLPGLGD